jgi:hypothetical protein
MLRIYDISVRWVREVRVVCAGKGKTKGLRQMSCQPQHNLVNLSQDTYTVVNLASIFDRNLYGVSAVPKAQEF